MPWKESLVIEERIKFIAAFKREEWIFADLCKEFGISRKTGYKYLERYEKEGIDGLKEKSRAPKVQPLETPKHIVDLIIRMREEHPSWGPRKLLWRLKVKYHRVKSWPSVTTIGNILKRKGLVRQQPRRKKTPQSLFPFSDAITPNDVWCADFKGHFTVGDGMRCDPLTITDANSRLLLDCQILKKTNTESVKQAFERVFKEYGLPLAIKTDNGSPFASKAIGGLSKLSVWWLKLGIRPERIEPGKPQQNGRHERMHRTLKQETALPPRASLEEQQQSFDRFKKEYNEIRPHEALGYQTPASVYIQSSRLFPSKLQEVAYPTHVVAEKVYESGFSQYGPHRVFFGAPLIGEIVGFEEISDRLCRIYFTNAVLGILDLYTGKVLKYEKLTYNLSY
ncbi:IS481 family transposase [Leptospira andrefontaineae]|uniref:IS481 family transposase n=1 Tax=Leptospira andrefontaineae TaxID=2484976 RepID=A0A4R9H6I5_9LEPT|nr:IS481 family transposase [Leptospira andrefontaineae]TGK41206.1 IS481 family transposase [Leptospira andrefontaineae]TGK41283.1 IS481 family transposase [Leptospira andrefontaineae]